MACIIICSQNLFGIYPWVNEDYKWHVMIREEIYVDAIKHALYNMKFKAQAAISIGISQSDKRVIVA